MDKDDRKLIVRLCTRAGMMMEDASAVAIGTAGLGPEALVEAVNELAIVAFDIEQIISAAAALAKSPQRYEQSSVRRQRSIRLGDAARKWWRSVIDWREGEASAMAADNAHRSI